MKRIVINFFFGMFLMPFMTFVFADVGFAFSMSITPAVKEYILNRGDEVEFDITFVNKSESGSFSVNLSDFVYSPSGALKVVSTKDLADPSQSLTNWAVYDKTIYSEMDAKSTVKIRLKIPENANYGDHYSRIQFMPSAVENKSTVTVSGGISTVLYVKVLGGNEIKSGSILSFDAISHPGARNPVTFSFQYENLGTVFYPVIAEVYIYELGKEDDADLDPIKKIKHKFTSFPNVVNQYTLPLGDLGNDFPPGKYVARLSAFEVSDMANERLIDSQTIDFEYFLPGEAVHAAPNVFEKDVIVTPSIVSVVQELFWYVMAFLVILLVSIRLLFYSRREMKKK